jgi:hypothetical protein
LGLWGKIELAALWKFRGELITFGHQTQPAFMREPLHASIMSVLSLVFRGELKNRKSRRLDFLIR